MDNILSLLSPLVGSGLVLVFLRLWTSELKDAVAKVVRRMDCFEASQHACQLDNAKNFATREEFSALSAKVDDIDTRVTRVEARK
jgi:hypothetical protein